MEVFCKSMDQEIHELSQKNTPFSMKTKMSASSGSAVVPLVKVIYLQTCHTKGSCIHWMAFFFLYFRFWQNLFPSQEMPNLGASQKWQNLGVPPPSSTPAINDFWAVHYNSLPVHVHTKYDGHHFNIVDLLQKNKWNSNIYKCQ